MRRAVTASTLAGAQRRVISAHFMDEPLPQPLPCEGRGAFGQEDLLLSLERGNLHLAAECRFGERDRDLAGDVTALPLEDRVRPHDRDHVQIAGWAAVRARLAFAGEADPVAGIDAGGDLY